MDRRRFLRGGSAPMRPPWSLDEEQFLDRCERCGDCVKACPEGILESGRGGYPRVNFANGGCSFCGDCLTACKGRALQGDAADVAAAWTLKAQIGGACLSAQGIVCRACGEVCDERAIRFRLQVGGVALPLLESGACNGCGACYRICPVSVIRIAASG